MVFRIYGRCRCVLSRSEEGEEPVAGQPAGGDATEPVDANAGQSAGLERVESNLFEAALSQPCPYLRCQVGRAPVPRPDHGRARTAQGGWTVRLMSPSLTLPKMPHSNSTSAGSASEKPTTTLASAWRIST